MIIFDFDQTLVDTSPVEHLRKARRWPEVMSQARKLLVYDGITDLLRDLNADGERLAIVTHSPDMVPREFVRVHRWPIDIILGYHQIGARKPAPDGLLRAAEVAGESAQTTAHVGDLALDTEAARAAGMFAFGSGWGSKDLEGLKASNPDKLCMTVRDLAKEIAKWRA